MKRMPNPRSRIILSALCASALLAQVQAGSIYRDVYLSPVGTNGTIASLTNDPTYPNSPDPSSSGELTGITIFDYQPSLGLNYGDRSRGFITAPQTGNYVFWIASDDYSQLWLSTDATAANQKLIASVTGYTGEQQWNKYPSQQSVPIALVKGQSYYLEVLHSQGTGSDNLSVGWQLPDGTLGQPMPLTYYEPYNPANSTPVITQDPQSTSGVEGSPVAFAVNLQPAAQPFTYQWYKNGVAISGATLPGYQYRATMADNNAQFTVHVGGSVVSGAATLSVSPAVAPVLTNVATMGYNTFVQISLSAPVTPQSATNVANYSISGGVIVSNVTLSADGMTISLFTSPFDPNAACTLTLANIQDYAAVPDVLNTNVQMTLLPGSIACEFFDGTFNATSDLTNAVNFPNSPDLVEYKTDFSSVDNFTLCGTAARGWIVPDTTDDYTFAVAGGWTDELYISTDETPANLGASPIAYKHYPDPFNGTINIFTGSPNQQSAPVHLVGGQRYFIQFLKTVVGGDTEFFGVAWANSANAPVENGDLPIPGMNLIPWCPPAVPLAINSQSASQTVYQYNPATLTVGIAGQPTYTSIQWYHNGQAIAGATAPSYSIASLGMADGGTYYATVKNLAYSLVSSNITLTVLGNTSPVVTSITTVDGQTFSVVYNQVMDPTTATNLANYNIPGVTFSSATLSTDGLTVTLVGLGSHAANYQVAISAVRNLGGLAIAANTVVTGHTLVNLIYNPGFETGDISGWNSGYGTRYATNSNAHSGTYSAAVIGAGTGADSALAQTISGLLPNTVYTFSGWFMGDSGYIIIGSGVATGPSTSNVLHTLTYSNGASATSVTITIYQYSGALYCDDLSFTAPVAQGLPLAVKSVTANGQTVTVSYNDYMDLPTASNPANYSIPGVTVTGATLLNDGMTVALTVTGTVPSTFLLAIRNVLDSIGDNNALSGTFTGTNPNAVINFGFETGNSTGWTVKAGTLTEVTTNVHSGTYTGCMSYESEIAQTITGLQPNTTYTFSGYFRTDAGNFYVGVKTFGGTDIQQIVNSRTYSPVSIPFKTGTTNTSVVLDFIVWNGTVGQNGFVDDLSLLVQKPVVLSLSGLGNQLQINWASGTLLSAPTVNGPWNPVPGALAPASYALPFTNSSMFFRAQQ